VHRLAGEMGMYDVVISNFSLVKCKGERNAGQLLKCLLKPPRVRHTSGLLLSV